MNDELSRTLKLCRIPNDETITIQFDNGATQIVRPTAAFRGDRRGLCEHIAKGCPFKIASPSNPPRQ